jgi:oxidase EvaA
MTHTFTASPDLSGTADRTRAADRVVAALAARTRSAPGGRTADLAEVERWFARLGRLARMSVRAVPLDTLAGWRRDPRSGDLGHESGRFFTVEGLAVHVDGAPVPRWSQPIINQPEVGILGLLVRRVDGVLRVLVQAKVEPGNSNGLQISPTVQATRSNFTRVHGGKGVPFLDHFRGVGPHRATPAAAPASGPAASRRLIADVRQSEHGSWFLHKRNRNMIVEVFDDIEVPPEFGWFTLSQLYRLLAEDDLMNMDTRSVLSCLPLADSGLGAAVPAGDDAFRAALARSCAGGVSRHRTEDILMWLTEARTRGEVRTGHVALDGLAHWRRTRTGISHESGLFFDVIGVDVRAGGREVARWMQPMIRPHGLGVVAFLVRRINGVLHLLTQARIEPGYVDVAELAPTVQCTPANLAYLPAAARPRFLDHVLGADPDRIRFAATLSEEGGRFYHARNRYLIVETDRDVATGPAEGPDYRWVTLGQVAGLLRHSHYVNVQARTLVACLHSLLGAER